jgi:hypothetical protein
MEYYNVSLTCGFVLPRALMNSIRLVSLDTDARLPFETCETDSRHALLGAPDGVRDDEFEHNHSPKRSALVRRSPNRNSHLPHMLAVPAELKSFAGAFEVPHPSVRDSIYL